MLSANKPAGKNDIQDKNSVAKTKNSEFHGKTRNLEKPVKNLKSELRSTAEQLGLSKENKHIKSPDLKQNARVTVDLKFGVKTLGDSGELKFSSNTSVKLNKNSQGFSLGLNQNLQTSVLLIFNSLPKPLQNILNKFTSQQIVSTLFLTAGIVAQIESKGLHNSETTQILKNLLIQISGNSHQSNNSGKHHYPNTSGNHSTTNTSGRHPNMSVSGDDPTRQIQILVSKTRVIFEHCGSSKKIQDLQKIALIIAKALEKGDVQTLGKLAEIVQKAQTQPEGLSDKVEKLLQQLMAKGEGQALKDAKQANLITQAENGQPKSSQNAELKNAPGNGQIQTSLTKTSLINGQIQTALTSDKQVSEQNQLIGFKDGISIKGKLDNEKIDFYTKKTETELRRQLDFYPHFAYDRQISTFENPKDINLGKQEFVNKHYSEIEDWLVSGKHRFVKDFDFEKPIGMIVDRNESGYITAEKLRVVLVRDGSVNGWHFLRSFLVS